jgi:non-heme chloroperoxidase
MSGVGVKAMPTLALEDGTQLFYKDWGSGQPVVFSHGWPLNADVWDEELALFASHGYRAIAHDRRGHGRSTQTWFGNNINQYAYDLAAITDALDLKDAIHVGHSTGGGEIACYIGRYGTRRVAKAVLVAAVPPIMLRTDKNPGGLPMRVFDDLRAAIASDRAQFYRDIALPFYGANRSGSSVSQGVLDTFWLWGMQVGYAAAYDCIKAFSETDFTEDLKRMDVPTLFIHGADDQIVPLADTSELAVRIVKGATLKTYLGAPHGLFVTHREEFHADLVEFAKS